MAAKKDWDELSEPVKMSRILGRVQYARKREEIAALLASIPEDTRDLTQRICGDPLPGRSALHRKQTGAE